MKRCPRSLAAGIVSLLLTPAVASAVAAEPYSDEPLTAAPLMSTAEVAVDLVGFNNWLNEHAAAIPEDRLPGPREHAYLLIDSILKAQRAEGRSTPTEFERVALGSLFNWATVLKVYGAGYLAQELGDGKHYTVHEVLLPSEPFVLRFESPHFVISSRDAPWRLTFPYHFMIWNISRFTATNGLATDLVVASTSFAKHSDGKGRSQATIMFVFSPDADCEAFGRYWLGQWALGPSDKTDAAPLPNAENYRGFDPAARLRKEATLVAVRGGCCAVIYGGIDGTFQANRVSYSDFLRSLRFGVDTSNEGMPPPSEPSREAGSP